MSKKVSVLIPCYNEEATIEELLSRVEAADFGSWEKEIIVVDDGSKDKTRSILTEYKNKPGYKIIFHPQNTGKGGVERTAIVAATGDYIVLQDADLEYDPREIKRMLDVVDVTGAPVVFGSRNMESPWNRLFTGFFLISIGAWVSTKMVNIFYGFKLTDAWTCYKLFSREVSRKAKFIGNGFEADYIFIGEVGVAGFPIVEVPISHKPRTVEEGKKIRYWDGLNSMVLLLKHRLIHLRSQKRLSSARSKERAEAQNSALICSDCKTKVKEASESFTCSNGHRYPVNNWGVPLMIKGGVFEEHEEEHLSGINWLKSFFKQFPFFYYYVVWGIFCPVLMVQNGPRRILRYVNSADEVLDIGSGPNRLHQKFINVDIFPFPEVDVVADAAALPFKDNAFSAAVNESLLEHVEDPSIIIRELLRVVKPGGYIYTSAPFIHPFHASPDDFHRWTASGLKALFKGCEMIELGVRSGPWSALLIHLAYMLGSVFSFGSRRAVPFVAHFFMLFLGPLKVFDLLFSYIPGAEAASAHLYIIVKTPEAES